MHSKLFSFITASHNSHKEAIYGVPRRAQFITFVIRQWLLILPDNEPTIIYIRLGSLQRDRELLGNFNTHLPRARIYIKYKFSTLAAIIRNKFPAANLTRTRRLCRRNLPRAKALESKQAHSERNSIDILQLSSLIPRRWRTSHLIHERKSGEIYTCSFVAPVSTPLSNIC